MDRWTLADLNEAAAAADAYGVREPTLTAAD